MNPAATLLSIHVGTAQVYGVDAAADPLDRPWRTAFFKSPVSGPVCVSGVGVAGDAQANRKFHGGPDKAVLAYAAGHYELWRAELAMPDMPYGGFAENFTVSGLDEDSVCIGDTFAIGDVQLQVTQPRQPCKNISHRWHLPQLTSLVEHTGRTGWYLRVLREGSVSAGCAIELVDRPAPDWSVTRASQVMRHRRRHPDEAAALAALPFLSAAWQRTIRGSRRSAPR